MTKKQKSIIVKQPKAAERLMLAKEWAMEDKIDPDLFLWWKEKMAKSQYEVIKQKVYNGGKRK